MCRVVALVALSGLLAACGDDRPQKIEGIADEPTASLSASPSRSTGAGAPTIELPADIKLVFDYAPTGNADKDAIVRDIEALERARHKVAAAGDRAAAPYQRYATGQALAIMDDWINRKLAKHHSTAGTRRYYAFTFHAIEDGAAKVTYCWDERQFFTKKSQTGQVVRTTPGLKDFSSVTVRVGKTPVGIWRSELYASTKGDPTCRSKA